MIKIALVDDHELFRKSIAMLLNSLEDIQVTFDTNDGNDLLKYLKKSPVDIAMIDLRMPQMDGYELCRLLKEKYPEVKVVIVSQLNIKESVYKCIELGADGFISKDAPTEQLLKGIKSVMDREYYFDMELTDLLKQAISNRHNGYHQEQSDRVHIGFSKREIEIIKLSCREFSNKQIAEHLNISTRTVEKHRNRMMERTGSKNFIGIIVFVLKHQLLYIEEV
jgi:DNA-binding NarL/FixJ family response regulator